jgi:MerR HTH family regulatory protein
MAVTFRNVESTFTAGEAERITGVSTATQRDWRRRGYLPSGKNGWTQYETMELGSLASMGALQDRGIGPKVSRPIARSAALRIMSYALSRPGAIEDQTDGEYTRFERKRGSQSVVNWTGGGHAQRYLVVWADGQMVFTSDIARAFGEAPENSKYQGAIIVLDLEALGALLVQRAGRPLVTVESGGSD